MKRRKSVPKNGLKEFFIMQMFVIFAVAVGMEIVHYTNGNQLLVFLGGLAGSAVCLLGYFFYFGFKLNITFLPIIYVFSLLFVVSLIGLFTWLTAGTIPFTSQVISFVIFAYYFLGTGIILLIILLNADFQVKSNKIAVLNVLQTILLWAVICYLPKFLNLLK